jgi:hypothetical protein
MPFLKAVYCLENSTTHLWKSRNFLMRDGMAGDSILNMGARFQNSRHHCRGRRFLFSLICFLENSTTHS